MVFLLDIDVLIALIDPSHVHRYPAHLWFAREGQAAWATCPLTQNGLPRIVGHPRYPNSPGTPAAVVPLMASLCALPGHVFWPDDITLLQAEGLDSSRLLSASQVTDTYLLALARARGGRLATFDRRLITDAVAAGAESLQLID